MRSPFYLRAIKTAIFPVLVAIAISVPMLIWSSLNPMAQQVLPAAISLSMVSVVVLLEFLLPKRREWLGWNFESKDDLLHSFVYFPIITQIASFAALKSSEFFRHFFSVSFDIDHLALPFLLKVLICIFTADLFFYWFHRLSHQTHFLWKFHKVHHSVETVYWGNAGRFHPLDLFCDFFFHMFPVFLLTSNLEIATLFIAINITTGLLEHANIDYRATPWNYFFNTADLHRWHHSTDIKTSNNNFGKIICFWDFVFKSRHLENSHGPEKVGI